MDAVSGPVSVKPAFQSTFPDSGDVTKFGPTAWNAARLFSGGSDGDQLVRDSLSATGASWSVVAAAAGALTGATLAANVLASSLTSVGTLASLAFGDGSSILRQDAANILALRNGANAQSFIVYNAFTDASNYARAALRFSGNSLQLQLEKLGTGVDSGLISIGRSGVGLVVRPDVNAFGASHDNLIDLSTTAVRMRSAFFGTSVVSLGANGQALNALKQLTELTTIAAAATTDTAIQMPTNAVILAVTVRTTVVIPTATSYSVGDSGSAARFNTANVGVAATSTDPGTKAGAYYNAGALSVRLTMNGGTPAAATGQVRVTIFYYDVTPATS